METFGKENPKKQEACEILCLGVMRSGPVCLAKQRGVTSVTERSIPSPVHSDSSHL